jgi:hypothetical protein
LPFRGNLQQVNDARAKREKPPGERVNQERDVSYPNV